LLHAVRGLLQAISALLRKHLSVHSLDGARDIFGPRNAQGFGSSTSFNSESERRMETVLM
jgi:hypothetical protein